MFIDDEASLNILSRQLIKEDTILTVDADKGKVKSSFGSGLFYMPHGLKIDSEGNTWVTDVGLHQVIKFNRGETQPSLGQFSASLLCLKSQKYFQCWVRSSYRAMTPPTSVNQHQWPWLLMGGSLWLTGKITHTHHLMTHND